MRIDSPQPSRSRFGLLSGTAYYMLRSLERNGWTHTRVLRFNFTYSLGGRAMMWGER